MRPCYSQKTRVTFLIIRAPPYKMILYGIITVNCGMIILIFNLIINEQNCQNSRYMVA